MVQLADLDAEPETLVATLDYFVDTKALPVTLVGAPGESDRRTGGGSGEQHRVALRNGRLEIDEFALERNGFRFVGHPTRVADFYDEDEIRRVSTRRWKLGDGRERRPPGRRVRPYPAHRRRRIAWRRRSAIRCGACTTTIPNGRRGSGCAI